MSATVLDELALVRYAQRTGSQEVHVAGAVVRFTLVQELFAADGRHIGTGRIEVTGRRTFGGAVHLDTTPDIEPPANAAPEYANDLARLAKDLLVILPTLCRCGLVKPECDCCATCGGRGTLSSEHGAKTCATCGGRGYLPGAG